MKTEQILSKAETLDHAQRWKYMISLGREARKNKALEKSLMALASSAIHYERLLALMSAQGSFSRELIAKLLQDPSSSGMGAVIPLAAVHLDGEQLISITPGLSKNKRMRVIAALYRADRTHIIEHIYTSFTALEQKNILPFTSEAFLRQHLDQATIDSLTEKQWRQIAMRFPAFAYQMMSDTLKKADNLSWQTQQAASSLLIQYRKTSPATGLSLLKQLIQRMHPFSLRLTSYALCYPNEVAQLVLQYSSLPAIHLPAAALRKLDNESLCALAEKNRLANLAAVFPKLRPEQRQALYRSRKEALRTAVGAIALPYLKALPKATREAEALHAFHAKLLAAKPLERLPYLSVLSFSQALPLASPFLSQPDGELRAAAVSALVQSGRYNSGELAPILDFCIQRANEQDPVRLAMILALAELPPSRWQPVHLPRLQAILASALKARDCSFPTMRAATLLLLKMLTIHTDFAIHELPALMERLGTLAVASQHYHMTTAELLRLDTCLTPSLQTWIARDRSRIAVSTAVSLIIQFRSKIKSVYRDMKSQGKALGLIQLLIDLTQDKRGDIARSGLEALIRLQIRDEVSQLIPRLLEQDSSWARVEGVSNYLHRRRQDLLTPFLFANVYSDRFSSGTTAILLTFNNGFFRWTSHQQQIYKDSSARILTSKHRAAWELYQCVHRLGAMPSADLKPLVQAAQLSAADTALRDKALEALGRADAGRGVKELLQALHDSRANVAIYALRRAITEMPAKKALSLLSEVPRNRITVLKEILRLAGELGGEEAYHFLLSFARDENLHLDVRIALLRALWKYLHTDEVWAYFHAAAQSEHDALARSTIHIPQEGLTPGGKNHLCTHMTLLLKNQNALVRKETLERLIHMPLSQASDTMLPILAGMLEDIDVKTGGLAAEAMLTMYLIKSSGQLAELFSKIKRPQSMAAVVNAFPRRSFAHPAQLSSCAWSLSHMILQQHRLPSQALHLTFLLLSPEQILAAIESADQMGLLHPGAVMSLLRYWHRVTEVFETEAICELERALRTSPSPGQRRLGLGLLTEAAKQHGWLEPWRECLCSYCDDTELWIAEAAGLIEPPPSLSEQ